MHESKGSNLSITGPRRFIIDLIHFARQVPSTPVARTVNVAALLQPRENHPARPSWQLLFMKAYAIVGANHPPLRRALLQFPWPRLYEHPWMNCALAIERSYQGEPGVFVALFRAPEKQTISELQNALTWYKHQPLEKVGVYRQALRVSRAPRPVRRLLWWSTLNISGYKRAKRFGTFGLTSYGSLGAESLHPISPLTTTLTFGPISDAGDVVVKLIYDHRVLDGAYIARRLCDIETTLNGLILAEMVADRASFATDNPTLPPRPDLRVEPLHGPHVLPPSVAARDEDKGYSQPSF
ncbi:MAG: hypothetical protein NVSMB9_19850 [Isosphaeraceae bacterium]